MLQNAMGKQFEGVRVGLKKLEERVGAAEAGMGGFGSWKKGVKKDLEGVLKRLGEVEKSVKDGVRDREREVKDRKREEDALWGVVGELRARLGKVEKVGLRLSNRADGEDRRERKRKREEGDIRKEQDRRKELKMTVAEAVKEINDQADQACSSKTNPFE